MSGSTQLRHPRRTVSVPGIGNYRLSAGRHPDRLARDGGIVKKIILQVRTDNQAGIGLYLRKDFVIEGTMRNAVFIDGTYYDLHWMGLEP